MPCAPCPSLKTSQNHGIYGWDFKDPRKWTLYGLGCPTFHKLNPGIISPKVHHQNIEYESTSKTTISTLFHINILFFPGLFFSFPWVFPRFFFNVSLVSARWTMPRPWRWRMKRPCTTRPWRTWPWPIFFWGGIVRGGVGWSGGVRWILLLQYIQCIYISYHIHIYRCDDINYIYIYWYIHYVIICNDIYIDMQSMHLSSFYLFYRDWVACVYIYIEL